MRRGSAALLVILLLSGMSSGCRLFFRMPEEITDLRVREVHGLGKIPEDETWWQTRDRRKKEQKELLFSFPLDQAWEQEFDPGRALSGAPVIDGRQIYLTESGEGLLLLNAEDGIPIWSLAPLPGESCGPLVAVDGLLVFGTSTGRVLAVDPAGPRLAWEAVLDEPPPGIPAAIAGTVFFPTLGGTVLALAASDGSLRWRFRTGEPMNAAPLGDESGGRLYCGSLGGTMFCLEAESGVVRWRYFTGSPIRGTPLLAGGRLFFGCDDGRFHCLDAEEGAPRWVKPTGAAIRTPPAAGEKLVLFGSWDGFLYALNTRNGRTRWKALLPNRIDIPPVCVDELVLAACLRSPELTALRLEDGKSAGSFKLEHLDAWFTVAPLLSEGYMLYAGTSRGKLLALEEVIEEEMSEEEASRARFEELLGSRREQRQSGGGAGGPAR
jgi:outer membrane protein assembly factor BamB